MGFRVFNSNQVFEKKFKFSFNSYKLTGILSGFLLTVSYFYDNFFRKHESSTLMEFTFAPYAMKAIFQTQ
jgi:hypothetical protein